MSSMKRFRPKQDNSQGFWTRMGVEDDATATSEAVHQGFKPIVYRKIVECIKLSQNEFHHVTRIPLSTIKRRLKNQERFSAQESDVMYRLASLLKLATELFESEARAQLWMREGVYGLAGKRPLDMIATTIDFEMVKDLIGRMEHGVFS
ncbi:type II RES/Xre toxin-antitoxin system antitoxin [Pelagibaculum spongiae]|nr:antitoxin Xre/MbcA/ParS toxin-binding domain-containing protein [Pelagibaculum spongiae]